ncbi:uncharacterized protein [Choristoneura fumiferana]|uniref:uncharacterized protein n=1 Tax=Choristoneura fumiferana TaxID=7141 RepID=UPI003D1584B5
MNSINLLGVQEPDNMKLLLIFIVALLVGLAACQANIDPTNMIGQAAEMDPTGTASKVLSSGKLHDCIAQNNFFLSFLLIVLALSSKLHFRIKFQVIAVNR